MIRRIILENYMSHARTVIEPARGLTVLVGPNNCGKSAVVSALQTLRGDHDGDFMVRHGEKACQVTIETEDGHTIVWRRIKGTVSWVIDGTEVYRARRGNLPDDLEPLLRLAKVDLQAGDPVDVHFGDQKTPIFLLGEESRAAAFFSSSSDAEKLLEIQRKHKEKAMLARRRQKELAVEVENLDRMLAALLPLDEVQVSLDQVDREQQELLDEDSRIQELSLLIGQIQTQQKLVDFRRAQARELSPLLAPPTLEDTRPLVAMIDQISRATLKRRHLHAQSQSMAPLSAPPALADTGPLQLAVKKLEQAQRELAFCEARERAASHVAPPPEMADDQSLQRLCERLKRTGELVERLTRTTGSLAHLAEPPVPRDLTTLADFLRRLGAAVKTARVAARRQQTLAALAEPTEPADASAMSEMIQRLVKSTAGVVGWQTGIREIVQQIQAVEEDMAEWLWANPTCPTCGAPTTKENLLAGGHSHG